MRAFRLLIAVALVGLATIPGVRRWSAERALYRASAALEILIAAPGQVPDREAALRWVGVESDRLSRHLPGDVRPLLLGGSSRLLAHDPAGALEWYARALAQGERAETDLNIGRAQMMRRELLPAQVAFLRAGWLTPLLLEELPPAAREPLQTELARLSAALEAGRLVSAPPPPQP
jgi:hypothetical protein